MSFTDFEICHEQWEQSYPVAGVEFCEVRNVKYQCEDRHWNDVDCAWEAARPGEREIILCCVEDRKILISLKNGCKVFYEGLTK